MKLLFIIPSITNYFTFLEDLIDTLIQEGHEVHLATSRKHIASIRAYRRGIGCIVHNIDFPRAIHPLKHFIKAQKVKKLVNDIRPHQIHVHFSAALFTTMLAKEAHWPVTIGTIHGLGSPLISGWRKFMISKAEIWSIQRTDMVYVLTDDDKVYLQENAPNAKVSVLASYGVGCNLEKFDRKNIQAEANAKLRAELGINENEFVYIFIGRQTIFKGFDKVVSAFLRVLKSHPSSKLLLVGEKDRIHPTSLHIKRELARSANPAIIHVGWRENVEDYIAISDLNVFPSEREGMPVNLMESLAMGVPVITINSRGCRDVVRNGIDGLVLQKNSVTALADAMRTLQDDQALRNTFSSNAIQGRDRFDRKKFIEDQLNIVNKQYDNKS